MLLLLVTEPARDFCYGSYFSFLILFSIVLFLYGFSFFTPMACCDECVRLEIFQTLLSGHFMISVKWDVTSDYWGVLKCHDNIPVIQIAGGGWSEKGYPRIKFQIPRYWNCTGWQALHLSLDSVCTCMQVWYRSFLHWDFPPFSPITHLTIIAHFN